MKYNPDIHQRHSIRLKGFDYSQAGAYFVTICVRNRECLFGNMVDGKVQMNDVGRVVQTVWEELPKRYPGVGTDASIVMPNHVHGIVVFTDHVGAGLALSNQNITPNKQGAASSAPTLGDIIRAFKSLSAIGVNRRFGRSGQSLWQRNYYEHILRTEDDLNRIRQYIRDNPMNWETDEENPKRTGLYPAGRFDKLLSWDG
ncbi:MAG TPA: transposase [Nitrospiria bacterium]|jgi:REP element-mobilizing transposase RayT